MDPLVRIKRLIIRGAVAFTEKALDEMDQDALTAEEVLEAVINAPCINKTMRSRSMHRRHSGEKLYVITSYTYDGTLIYTKGTIVEKGGQETFYIFISSKISSFN